MADHFGKEDINKYRKFKKVDGATYRKVNQFLRKRTYITAREWAIARLCTDFRTRSGAEMTFIGQHLPELVPFMQDVYTPQAVNQARNSFKKKVYKSGATFFYGAMCGFFTTEELDDLLFEASEVARFLLEVERTSLEIDDEIDIEDRITKVMRSVGAAASVILRARELAAAPESAGGSEPVAEIVQEARIPGGDAAKVASGSADPYEIEELPGNREPDNGITVPLQPEGPKTLDITEQDIPVTTVNETTTGSPDTSDTRGTTDEKALHNHEPEESA
jgi:hypothetical protein